MSHQLANHLMVKPRPTLVSVWVLTYNHADFIGQCLDSILSQQTSFGYEICIGEDDSSDGTREICIEYEKRFPEKIKLYLRDRHSPERYECAGRWQYNFIETFNACNGQYIAMCDGDDFWSDNLKLQKQINYLENNPDCSGCFHKIGLIDQNNVILKHCTGKPAIVKEKYDLDYALSYSNFSPMFSTVFRNHEDVAPNWIKMAPFGDLIIHVNNLRRGKYGFIDEVMGYYRIHSGGLASGKKRSMNVRDTIEVYKLMGDHFNLTDKRAFRRGVFALRVSYFAERLLEFVLPDAIKRFYDLHFGKRFRFTARKILTREK